MPPIPTHISSGNVGVSQIGLAPAAAFGDSSGLAQVGSSISQAGRQAASIGQVMKARESHDARRDVTIALKEDELAMKRFHLANEGAENLEELTLDFAKTRTEARTELFGKRREAHSLYTQASQLTNSEWQFEAQKMDVGTRRVKYGRGLDEHSQISDELIYNAAKGDGGEAIATFLKERASYDLMVDGAEDAEIITDPLVIDKMRANFAPMAMTMVNTLMGTAPERVEAALDAAGDLIDGKQKGTLLRQARNQMKSNDSKFSAAQDRGWDNAMRSLTKDGNTAGFDTESYIASQSEHNQILLRDQLDVAATGYEVNIDLGGAPLKAMPGIVESWKKGAENRDLVYQEKLAKGLNALLKHHQEMYVDDTFGWANQDSQMQARSNDFLDAGVHPDRQYNADILAYMEDNNVPSSMRKLLSKAEAATIGETLKHAADSAGEDASAVGRVYNDIEARFHNDPEHIDIAKGQILEASGLKLSHAMAYDIFDVNEAGQTVAAMGSAQKVDPTFGANLTTAIHESVEMGQWVSSMQAMGMSPELAEKLTAMRELTFAAGVRDSAHMSEVGEVAASGVERTITRQSIFLGVDSNRFPVRVPAEWGRNADEIESGFEDIQDTYNLGNRQGMRVPGMSDLMTDEEFNEKVRTDGYWGTGPDDKGAYLMIPAAVGGVPIAVHDENGEPLFRDWGTLERRGFDIADTGLDLVKLRAGAF